MPSEVGPPQGVFSKRAINWEEEATAAGFQHKELPREMVNLVGDAHATLEQALSCERALEYSYNRQRWLHGEAEADAFLAQKAIKLRAQKSQLRRAKFTVVPQAVALAVLSGATGAVISAYATGGLPILIG